jgi:hypothetical protein
MGSNRVQTIPAAGGSCDEFGSWPASKIDAVSPKLPGPRKSQVLCSRAGKQSTRTSPAPRTDCPLRAQRAARFCKAVQAALQRPRR